MRLSERERERERETLSPALKISALKHKKFQRFLLELKFIILRMNKLIINVNLTKFKNINNFLINFKMI